MSDDANDRLLEKIYEDLLDEGFSPEEAAKKAREMFEKMADPMATGGRVNYAKGTKMASVDDPFYRDSEGDRDEHSMRLFGKPYKELNAGELEEFREEMMRLMNKFMAKGGRVGLAYGDTAQAAGIMGNLPVRKNKAGVTELDLRETGGFIPPVGIKEKADDVPAMLSNNEFVFTADAVRAVGNGNVNKGAQILYDKMKQLESKVG